MFPTPETMVAAGPGSVIAAWADLAIRAGRGASTTLRASSQRRVGRPTSRVFRASVAYTGGSHRRTGPRHRRSCGRREHPPRHRTHCRSTPTMSEAEASLLAIGEGLISRDRLLAVMDVGATLCTRNAPLCDECPFSSLCAFRQAITRGEALPDIRRSSRQAAYIGSFRQRRGEVLATLRMGTAFAADLDQEALHSLVTDGLAEITGDTASLPTRQAFVEEHKAVPSARA